MTYFIASEIGLRDYETPLGFSEAYVIAWADQFTDVSEKTRPVPQGGWLQKAGEALDVERRRTFHFRAPVFEDGSIAPNVTLAQVQAGSGFASEPLYMGIKAGDPMLTGIGLHAYQDSWSHEGYDAKWGHLGAYDAGHGPDYPWRQPQKALKMAEMTYRMLVAYLEVNHPGAKPKRTWEGISSEISNLLVAPGTIDDYRKEPWDGEHDARELANRIDSWSRFFAERNLDAGMADDPADSWAAQFNTAAAKVPRVPTLKPGTKMNWPKNPLGDIPDPPE